MQVEWDVTKNARNIVKHGVSFDIAGRAFAKRMVQWRDKRLEYGEERWSGLADIDGDVYFVAWTVRGPETTRLITARRANERERKKFRSQIATPSSDSPVEDSAEKP